MATRKALVIGVNDYGGPPNDLPSCVEDANAVTQLLQSRFGFKEVHTLRDGDATIARVEDELQWLAGNSKPDDRLVFYFSGHGSTSLTDGVLQEFLVLHDGLFDDSPLVNQTRDLAPGTLTVILDASFSGGMEKVIFDPAGATPDVEVVKVKAWHPPHEEGERDTGFVATGHETVRELRRFGWTPVASPAAIARTLAAEAFASRATQSAPSASAGMSWLPATAATTDEAGQLQLNGLLLGACLETEAAVACTAKTDGRSAFTYALLRSVERPGGISPSTADVVAATENQLKALGVRQTPLVLERAIPGNLKHRSFITLESTTDNLGYLSEPRFWEGLLTAMAPQIHALRAVYAKEGDPMSTMYQPTMPGYQQGPNYQQGAMGGFQPGLGTGFQPGLGVGQPSPDDVQRLLPILGPILATVIPAVVPQIINSIANQQRSFGGGMGLGGSQQQTSPEDLQRLLPVLGPVLANVIPAILPQIINSLAQQRSMGQWGGQMPSFGQFGGQQQFGGGQFGGQDLTHTVAHSVQDALQRIGMQQGFGQQPFFGQSPQFGGRF